MIEEHDIWNKTLGGCFWKVYCNFINFLNKSSIDSKDIKKSKIDKVILTNFKVWKLNKVVTKSKFTF